MAEDKARDVHVWANPPETKLPITRLPFRFAIGTPAGPSTNSWRVWAHGEDVYVKCRDNFREMKASLHASGRWRFGFTQEAIEARPDLLPEGTDRALTKWESRLDRSNRLEVGLQIVALKGGLYLSPEKRTSWPPSVLFIEPLDDPAKITVVSVMIAETHRPIRIASDTHGAVLAIMPLNSERTLQVVASYEDVGSMENTITEAFRRAIQRLGGPQQLPEDGVFFVHGKRGEKVPWISAVRFIKT